MFGFSTELVWLGGAGAASPLWWRPFCDWLKLSPLTTAATVAWIMAALFLVKQPHRRRHRHPLLPPPSQSTALTFATCHWTFCGRKLEFYRRTLHCSGKLRQWKFILFTSACMLKINGTLSNAHLLILRVFSVLFSVLLSQWHDSVELRPSWRDCRWRYACHRTVSSSTHWFCLENSELHIPLFLEVQFWFPAISSCWCCISAFFSCAPYPVFFIFLSPSSVHGDQLLWSALEKCSLAGAVAGMGTGTERGLDAPVSFSSYSSFVRLSYSSKGVLLSDWFHNVQERSCFLVGLFLISFSRCLLIKF